MLVAALFSALNGGRLPWQDVRVEHVDRFDFCALCG